MDNSYCCVPQCTTHGNERPRQSFHRFPPVKENKGIRRLRWIAKLRIGKKVSHRMVVCGKHFKSSDFFPVTAGSGGLKRRKLKKIAIPSCNLPTSSECKDEKKDNIKIFKIKQLTNINKAPIIERMTPSKLPMLSLEESNSHDFSVHQEKARNKISVDDTSKKCMNTSLSIMVPNESTVDVNAIALTSKNSQKDTKNCTIILSPMKFEENNTKFNYSVLKSSHGENSEETLNQKLDTMVSVNVLLQKKVDFLQNKCKMYEKEFAIMKDVIDNLKQINSVTFNN